ncbi:hypothetical protein N4T77_14600 [Clostridium sp. CX1]|uniref:Uncharacterized protein n=1 Tax=Clostridium tanneri TaxID=3037988 RepID=A0ABU4JRN9_9CLOT|nr:MULTISPECIES: hypothetical protein [unclassified Clostridium]MCT8977828.1 hypothetical protein [Clostridium sp. CX1]MDW8800818.1 hypothetical protein [Clostridium sp. A1-XYC3]
MDIKSNVDLEKLNRIDSGQSFEYRDIVKEDLPLSRHPEDGALFKKEVEDGVVDDVVVSDPGANHIEYKKL